MDREFLDLYNSELRLLYEHAKEFAEEYPGIAERLGGLIAERTDPMIAGLLEGAAFLAARVQLKLKHEFPEFCLNLIEQLAPNYLAPTPSAILAQASPPAGDTALREGRRIERGAYLDATYREFDRNGGAAKADGGAQRDGGGSRGGRRLTCRFRLTSDITIWPFEIVEARYDVTPGPILALGLEADQNFLAGLRITIAHKRPEEKSGVTNAANAEPQPEFWFKGCKVNDLTFHLVGGEADAIAIYEQIFANCVGVYLRYVDKFETPKTLKLDPANVEQIGFDDSEALLPKDDRLFAGFDLLREYFMFPRKFLGFRLTGLKATLAEIPASTADIIFVFNEINTRLPAVATRPMFALYAAPAINLFEKTLDRIPVKPNQHEYHVVPDRSRYLDFEPHRMIEVFAHYRGLREKIKVPPLYAPSIETNGRNIRYTSRRLRRRRTDIERRQGQTPSYVGTDMFISLVEPAGVDRENAVVELSARAQCTNRHLAQHLPVGPAGAEFKLVDQTELEIFCIAGPTPPREPVVKYLRSRSETANAGTVAWRLINLFSLNHLGLIERDVGELADQPYQAARGGGANAAALRETLAMFADMTDNATERRIRGVHHVASRPVVRRMRQGGGVGVARGVEITITVDENAFEGAGAFLLGAVLERFFSEYASLNHFTQTIVRSLGRGEIARWPPRAGARRLA
jgi:type VI secretion system protein ImpG